MDNFFLNSVYKQPLFVWNWKIEGDDMTYVAAQCNETLVQCNETKHNIIIYNKNGPHTCCMILTKLMPISFLLGNALIGIASNHKI